MSELKWIKIVTDIFDDEKIKIIEQMPEGDTILVVWFKLLAIAGKKNDSGLIYITKDVPYTEETLPIILGRKKNIVTLSLQTFEKLEMIEIINDIITILNWEKHQSTDKIDKMKEQNKIRQKRYRNYQKLIAGSNGKCIYCGEKDNELTIDHIIPVSKGGSDENENKILCCLKCNMSKTNRDIDIFLNEKILLKYPIDINAITHNNKIMNILSYENGKFIKKITQEITHSNTTDKNRIDVDKTRKEKDICDSLESPVPEKPMKGKPKKKKPEKSEEDKELYQKIQKTCEREYGTFESYPIQGTAINHMIRKAKIRDPTNPGEIIRKVFQAFREFKAGKEPFWKSQPFLPAVINSEGIWTRLIEKINQDEKIQSGPDYSDLER